MLPSATEYNVLMIDIVRAAQLCMTLEEKVTFINSRGDSLSGILHYPTSGNAQGTVILCHGMESSKDSEKLISLGQSLAERHLVTLRFDFACSAESGKFEEITYSGEVEDLRAAFSFLTKRWPGKIGILGSSMGGTVALLFAAQEPGVTALTTLAAPIHPERFPERLLTPEQVRQWREQGFTYFHGQRINVSLLNDLEKINVLEAVRHLSCPVLILHGDEDEVVPVEEARELHDCLPNARKLLILMGADHRLSDPALMSRAIREAVAWLCQHVC
jgi:putative redox protein